MNTLLRSVGASLGSQVTAAILAGTLVAGTGLPTDAGFTAAYLVCAGVAALAALIAIVIPRGAHHVIRVRVERGGTARHADRAMTETLPSARTPSATASA